MRLYVGNLSYNVTNQSLEQLFAEYGQVKSAQVVQDRDTGRSKGFGFVEFEDEAAAKAAIEGMNGKEIEGRRINVSEALDALLRICSSQSKRTVHQHSSTACIAQCGSHPLSLGRSR